MINIAICDDDIYFTAELEKVLYNLSDQIYDEMRIIRYYSGESIAASLRKGRKFDFIFLDIELGDLSGIEVGKIIRDELHNENTMIVFVSGKEEYAMELFSIRPLNFLIKSLNPDKVREVFFKGLELSNKFVKLFEYKVGFLIKKRCLKNIIYFESYGKEIHIVTTEGTDIFYFTLKRIYEELKNFNFFYCHKSYLVNYYNIKEFYYDKLVMINNVIIPIAQPRRKDIRRMQNDIENGEY